MNLKKINYEHEIILELIKNKMHGRELAKKLNTSLTRIQHILSELRDQNAIDYKIEGKNHIYFIKKNMIGKLSIINAENYKLKKILIKYPSLENIFTEIKTKYPKNMIILFGSYAKFSSKEESDIDIYIDTTDKKMKETLKQINFKLNGKNGAFDKKDLLIQEIIKNHAIINGAEEFYEQNGFIE